MASLYLTDILKRAGLDPKKVMLIRHSLSDKDFKKCYDAGMVQEYTRHQKENFAKGAEYWAVFVSDKSTKARFYACYKVDGSPVRSNADMAVEGFPYPDWYTNEGEYLHNLQKTDIMSDMEKRLVIEWGRATTAWYQWGTNEKEIVGIQMNQKTEFKGFDKLILTYDELQEIINESELYDNWHEVMKSVYAIYLISDRVDGEMYVGAAYSKNGGLLSRWTEYIKTRHGENSKMKKKLAEYPERYHDFQFQVLQILPKTLSDDEVIRIESLWKDKLLTRKFGMNDN